MFFCAFTITTSINQSILTSAAPPPTYLSPADGSYTNDDTPTFTWSAVSSATSYTIEYGLDQFFIQSIDFTVPASQTNYTISLGMSDNLIYWHVRTNDAGGFGDWALSPIWTLTIDTVVVPEFDLIVPIYIMTSVLALTVIVITSKKKR